MFTQSLPYRRSLTRTPYPSSLFSAGSIKNPPVITNSVCVSACLVNGSPVLTDCAAVPLLSSTISSGVCVCVRERVSECVRVRE